MSLFVLDTDILSMWQRGQPNICAQIAAHLPMELAITIITVQEQLDGWHSRLKQTKAHTEMANLYQRLTDTVRFLSGV